MSISSSTNIILNLSAVNSTVTVYAKQNDRLSRHIVAALYDGNAPWTPPAGAVAVIRYRKPDGTVGFYDTDEDGNAAISVSGNVATLTIVEQALTVPGDVWMELNFYNTGDEKLTTLYWLMKVQQSVLDDGTIISSDYFNSLTALYSQISAIAADLPVPATATPLMDGVASAGSSADFARGDHKHPSDTSRLPLIGNLGNLNPVADLNSFVTGEGIFNDVGGSTVAHFPYDYSTETAWARVVSAGDGANTGIQIGYDLYNFWPPRVRYKTSGTWTAWSDMKTSATALKGAVPIANGGTGATSLSDAQTALGIANSGWTEVTFSADFKNYGTTNKCQYCKFGSVVTVCGVATPVNDLPKSGDNTNTNYTMFTLPSGYRPKTSITALMQGSGTNKWMLQIGTNGDVMFSRYSDGTGGTTAAGGSPGAWLPFYATFIIA